MSAQQVHTVRQLWCKEEHSTVEQCTLTNEPSTIAMHAVEAWLWHQTVHHDTAGLEAHRAAV
jgi:hypothetical protein